MSSKTTTDNPASRMPYHDLFFKDVLASFPGLRQELVELSLPSALRSELDTDHIDYQTEILGSAWQVELRPDGLMSMKINQASEADPRAQFVLEFKSHPDSHTIDQVARYMYSVGYAHPNALVMAVVVYHGEQHWDFDPTHPASLKLLSEELRKHDVKSLHFRVLFVNLMDEPVVKVAQDLKFASVFYILTHIWHLDDAVVGQMLRLASEKLHGMAGYDSLCASMVAYVSQRDPKYKSRERLIEIEKLNVEPDKRIMKKVLTILDAYTLQDRLEARQEGIQEGIQEGRQEGRQEATQERNWEFAESLLRDNFDDSTVVKHSGLSPDDVSELRHKLNGVGS